MRSSIAGSGSIARLPLYLTLISEFPHGTCMTSKSQLPFHSNHKAILSNDTAPVIVPMGGSCSMWGPAVRYLGVCARDLSGVKWSYFTSIIVTLYDPP